MVDHKQSQPSIGTLVMEFLRNLIEGGPDQKMPVAGNTGAINYVPLRQTPKGTYIEEQGEGTVTLRVKAVVRFWWLLPYGLLAATVFL